MSDTPRTDAAVMSNGLVGAIFARQLEQELIAKSNAFDKVHAAYEAAHAINVELRKQLAAMQRQRDMLHSMLIENVTFTDEQLKEAGLGVGINIEIRHDLPLVRAQLAAKEREHKAELQMACSRAQIAEMKLTTLQPVARELAEALKQDALWPITGDKAPLSLTGEFSSGGSLTAGPSNCSKAHKAIKQVLTTYNSLPPELK